MIDPHLVIADQPTRLDEPAESPLDDPSLGQDLEAFHVVAALDDLQVDLPVTGKIGDLFFELPGVASIRPDPFEPAIGPGERWQQQSGPIAILDVCRRDLHVEDEPEGVYQ